MEETKSGKKKSVNTKRKISVEEEEEEEETVQDENKNCLYDLLNVPKTASTAEIKKSYRALALKLHPDKNVEDPEATKNFQKLSEAYQILIDPDKRRLYDQTGYTGQDDSAGFYEAYNYYRSMYKKIEKEDIDAFAKKYRFSDEEANDLLNFYTDNKGDVTALLENIMLSENEDIPRFVELIEKKIQEGVVRKYKNWDKTKNQIIELPDESELVKQQQEESLKELAKNILAKRDNVFASVLASIETKYAKKNTKKGQKQKDEYDIDEETFQKIQQNREKNAKKTKK